MTSRLDRLRYRTARCCALLVAIAAWSANSDAEIHDLDLPDPASAQSTPTHGDASAKRCNGDDYLGTLLWRHADPLWMIVSMQRNDAKVTIAGRTARPAAISALLKKLKQRGYPEVNLAMLETPAVPKEKRYAFSIELLRDCAGG